MTKIFILHIKGPESAQDFTVPSGITIIGRDASAGLPLPFPLVSRKHAQLDCSEASCTITDLGSSNGTLLNNSPISPHTATPLAQGDLLGIGPFEITCEVVSAEVAPPPPEPEPIPAAESVSEPAPEAPAEEKPAPVKVEKPAGAGKVPRAAKEPTRQPPAPAGPAAPPPGAELPSAPDPSILPVGQLPPGLTMNSLLLLLPNLPGIYHTDFMSRLLALFEATELPIVWTINHFNLFLSPGTSPIALLTWLANWYEIVFDSTWSEARRRTLLKEAGHIYALRGTRWALARVLEIYLGEAPEIIEFQDPRDPYTFTVKLPVALGQVSRELLVQMIDTNKPAHTNYHLEFRT